MRKGERQERGVRGGDTRYAKPRGRGSREPHDNIMRSVDVNETIPKKRSGTCSKEILIA